MNSNYEIFFAIDLFHQYASNGLCTQLEVIPCPETIGLAKNLNIRFRNKPNGLFGFIQVAAKGEPDINEQGRRNYPDYYSKSVLRFYLKVNDPAFLTYTNDHQVNTRRQICYFSNLNNSVYLNAPIDEYHNGTTYLPGDLVLDGSNHFVYEALRKTNAKRKAQLNDPELWTLKWGAPEKSGVPAFHDDKEYKPGEHVQVDREEAVYTSLRRQTSTPGDLNDPCLWRSDGDGPLQFVNRNDLVDRSTGTYFFQLDQPVREANTVISGFNYDSEKPAHDQPVAEQHFAQVAPSSVIPVNFGKVNPGRYLVTIGEQSKMVYYDPLVNSAGIIGVIELFQHLPAAAAGSLLDDDRRLKHVRFKLQFANRSVLWKYIRKDSRPASISDTAEGGYVFERSGNCFVSTRPIPLTEGTLKTLKLDFETRDFMIFPLPNPPVNRLTVHHQNDFNYPCSEVVLSY